MCHKVCGFSIYNKINIVIMKRVVIFIVFMLIGFTSCNKMRYASHFIHDGYMVMYGEYEVNSVICFDEWMPEHLIEPATEIILKDRLLQDGSKLTINHDMTYSLKESGKVVSSGTYKIGVYENAPCIEFCYYYPGARSFKGYLDLIDENGEKLSFGLFVAAHENPTIQYATLWPYQGFEMRDSELSYSYGIRYGLTYCE